jgi:ABC-type antimicrobial peptide transport system permease subunit
MGCANVGCLFMVHEARRILHISVRYALGAKRAHVVQQLLIEGLLLGLLGGALGMAIASQCYS